MFTRFSKNALCSKIVAVMAMVSFILSSVPVSYAGVFVSHSLRTPANRSSARLEDIQGDLGNAVKPEKIDPLVLSNITSLLKGAQTRGSNIEDAILNGANGLLLNHSEARGDLEDRMTDMLRSVVNLVDRKASESEINAKCAKTLEIVGLSEKYYKEEVGVTNSWVSEIRLLATTIASHKESVRKLAAAYPNSLPGRIENEENEIKAQEKELDLMIQRGARKIVNKIMNTQLKEVIAYSQKYSFAQNVLCVGETKEQYDAGKTKEILKQDLEEILVGISKEQARKIVLRIAYEARWVIGKKEIPKEVLTKIDEIQAFVKGISKELLGEELMVDYGASVNKDNAGLIFSLPHVDGVLIGGAAKKPEEMSPIIDEAIKQGQIKRKLLNVGLNWKAENESTGLESVDVFKDLFRTKDLSKVGIVISTGNVKFVRDEMTKLENEISAVFLYSGIVVKTETVGPFTKETLAAKSQNTKDIYVELEKRFGDQTREGDVYFRLKIGNRYFVLAKENTKDATLMTATTLDLKDAKTKAEYYGALLNYASLITIQANKGIDLIEEKGDRLKQFMASNLLSIDKSIQMIFKQNSRPIARGWSLFVQPAGLAEVAKAEPEAAAEAENNSIPIINVYTEKDLKGRKVLIRVDFNVSDEQGKIKSVKRLVEALPTLNYLMKNGATVILVSHNGRPGGKVKPELSMEPVAERLDELVKGEGIRVVFHKDSITDKGLAEGLKERIVAGAINVLENTRFYKGEENNDQVFAKALASLADNYLYVFDAFGTAERLHASTGGAASYTERIALGFLMEKENKYLQDALQKLSGLIIGGGPKVKEKLPVVEHVIPNLKAGGFIIIGTGPVAAFLKELYGIEIGQKSSEEDIANAQKIIRIAKEKNVTIVLPIDFVAVDRDLSAKSEGDKSWLDLSKIPEGANIYRVSLEQLKAGKFTDDKGQEVLTNNLYVYDVGEATQKLFDEVVLKTEKGKAVFYNGMVGVEEIPAFASGSKALSKTLVKATEQGIDTVVAGGDTTKSAEKNKIDKLVTHASTGGGASAAVLKGEKLQVIEALEGIQATINTAKKLNVAVEELRGFMGADKTIFDTQGGKQFGEYVDSLLSYLPARKKQLAERKQNGDLSLSKLEAQAITDSRGKSTVRVMLKIDGLETIGEVPAGASKGEDEAVTVSTEQAIRNINEIIAPLLKNSGLDLTKYQDLKRAEAMIVEKAGKNFKELGANAVVPVSWALWRMTARLNNKDLWEIIRENEPQAIGDDSVYFYMNIYNGGLHALKGNEKLGRDRIDIQEIMIVPVGAKSYSQALEMGDKIDQALKKILEGRYQTALISRADEAGFSVKGLGDSSEAIGHVLQAIQNAGYESGKDVKLALDVAATTFSDKKAENKYEFQGQTLTSEEMVNYYMKLVDKYPGKIISIEDGLAENDWNGWAKLTAEMSKRGVLTIGDDLFVTQMARLQKGIESKAATAILIKVNQNGTLGGTLEVMKYAKQNGLKFVVSHRSGETLDDGIADLAYASRALGLKTGDPQPKVDFQDDTKLVRRNKYLRMVNIQGERALVIGPAFFKAGGVKNALNEVAELSKVMRIALYGEKAENLKIVLGNKDIITGKSLEEVLSGLSDSGILAENTLLLKSPDDKLESSIAERMEKQKIRQIVADQISTIALAKAVKELGNNDVADKAFADFYEKMAKQGVISEQAYNETREAMLKKLEEGIFALPDNIKLTEQVSNRVKEARVAIEEFVNKV